MITRFFIWWEWRCLAVGAYLTSYTEDQKLASDLENQARNAKNKLDDYDMNKRFTRC